MIDLQAFAGANIATFFLVFARVGGVFVLAPVFASRMVPVRARLMIALAISLAAYPAAARHGVQLDPIEIGPLMVKEVLVGSALAFGVAATFAAVEMAGSLIDTSIGFSLAQIVDPALNFQSSVVAQVYSLVATMVFLATGAFLAVVAGVVRSFDVLPVDQMPPIASLTGLVTNAMAPILTIALQIAAPILATLLVTDVGFAFLARLVPQLNPFAAQFSVKIIVGLGAAALAMPYTIQLVSDEINRTLIASGLMLGGHG